MLPAVFENKTPHKELNKLKQPRVDYFEGKRGACKYTVLKVLFRDKNKEKETDQFKRVQAEIRRLKRIKSPYSLDIDYVHRQEGLCFWLVTDEIACRARTVGKRISPKDPKSFRLLYHIMVPILKALEFMRKEQLMHGGVSPDNIFITVYGVPKLGNLAHTRRFKDNPLSEKQYGNEEFVPPEVIRGKGTANHKIDVWAWAISCLSILRSGDYRFLTNQEELFQHYENAKFSSAEESQESNETIWQVFHLAPKNEIIPEEAEFREWFRSICIMNPAERPEAPEICKTEIAMRHLNKWKQETANPDFQKDHKLLYDDLKEQGFKLRRQAGLKKDISGLRPKKTNSSIINFFEYVVP